MNRILEELKKIDGNFERDDIGQGYGVKSQCGKFLRIKPFWISDYELENSLK